LTAERPVMLSGAQRSRSIYFPAGNSQWI